MEKLYTSKVGKELTERLYKAGMPLKVNVDYDLNKYTNMIERKLDIEPPSYAKTIDWFMSIGLMIHIYSFPCWHRGENEYCSTEFDITIHDEKKHEVMPPSKDASFQTWHEAANYGIENALEVYETEKD